jgi:hypothetical protein
MGQRLAQSIGIGFAATLLRLFQGSAHKVTVATIAPTFLIIGAVALVSASFFFVLPKDAGESLNGRPSRLRT